MSNKLSKFTFAVAMGAAAGYIASLFVPEETKQKHKRQLTTKAEDLDRILRDPQERERVKEIFKKNSQEVTDTFNSVKSELAVNLATLKGSLTQIDKRKYTQAVDQAMNFASEQQQLPSAQLKRLRDYLLADYDRIKKDFQAKAKAKTKSQKKA